MTTKGYLIFHINLGFSSIEEEDYKRVINTCYHSLLDLVEDSGVQIGIELTGWTLEKINKIDKHWIERFKKLLNSNRCELIGSGFTQIIGPLVPYEVNEWNQKLGLDSYQNILGQRPNIVLVNEMSYSYSLIDLYMKFQYKGFIMDRDNIKLALDIEKSSSNIMPTHAKGSNKVEMPILWSDSIMFQKMQHFAHGDISSSDYFDYLNKRIISGDKLLPVYSNDAEVFDYRPGRFNEERSINPDGEWKRITKLLKLISSNLDVQLVSPSKALEINNASLNKHVSFLTSASYPIPVKKQSKYNIARWAVTGRDDLWLNTICHRIQRHFSNTKNSNPDEWRKLCEFWSSDLRSHITEKRWDIANTQLNLFLKKFDISGNSKISSSDCNNYDSLEDVKGKYGNAIIQKDNEGILLSISTKKIKIELNLRRGLAIQRLSFASQGYEPCIGTLPHGHFSTISLGADFYSGGLVIELPLQRKRITDLEKIDPKFRIKDNGDIEISVEIKTQLGSIIKLVTISTSEEKISLSYSFLNWSRFFGSVRLGIITLINRFSSSETTLSCFNGGEHNEIFTLDGNIDHTKPASTLVSSSRGLGATTGSIKVKNSDQTIDLEWNPAQCAVMPMLVNIESGQSCLTRVLFSVKEFDDTSKTSSNIMDFSLNITAT